MIIFHPICGISVTNPPTSLLFISLSHTIPPPLLLLLHHSLMYPNIEHIFFSMMPKSDLFLTKENPEDVSNFEIEIEPTFQFQNLFHESVPNCSKSPTSFDSVVLESSTRLENPISNLNQGQINQKSSSQSHSCEQKEEKKEEAEGGYEVPGPLLLLLSKENCKLKVEEEDEEEEEEEDGFRTPTSLDHRIPEAKQCPPAPKKPKPSLKRQAPHTHTDTSTPLHLSKEVRLLFPTQHNPLSDSHRITKKVRRDDPK